MDNDDITILREQLREKDKQIAELQKIICNLMEAQKDDTECIEEYDQKLGFWERHVKLSYIALCVVIMLGLIVLVSPFVMPSLWERMGHSKNLYYFYSMILLFALVGYTWVRTASGRK